MPARRRTRRVQRRSQSRPDRSELASGRGGPASRSSSGPDGRGQTDAPERTTCSAHPSGPQFRGGPPRSAGRRPGSRAGPSVDDRLHRVTAYHLASQRHYRDGENYAYVPATGLITRNSYIQIYHDQQQIGDRFDATFRNTFLGFSNTFLIDFDANHIDFKHTNNSPYAGVTNVQPVGFDPGLSPEYVAHPPGLQEVVAMDPVERHLIAPPGVVAGLHQSSTCSPVSRWRPAKSRSGSAPR